jgi:hypothetical protein
MKTIKNLIGNILKSNVVLLLSGLFLISLSSCSHPKKINSVDALMKEISSRYNGKWFTHAKFSQTADSYENDLQVKSEIWDEEYRFPSNLVIYMTPGDTAKKYVCRNDSVLIYENSILTHEEKLTHDALILSKDIFNMTYEEIMTRLGDLQYDIGKFYETACNGRKIYVMGAAEGDTASSQAWFDAEHLYLTKIIKPTEQGLKEVEFLNSIQLDKGWIEQEVIFRMNGKIYMIEKYFNISVE